MTEGELKPCPFCGEQPVLLETVETHPDRYTRWYNVRCETCGIEPGAEYESEVIAAWNTRTPTATPSDEVVEEFLHELNGWERAYPLSVFPEPDMRKAADLLKAGGMTLDAISASNMRHVVSQIAPKARAAIAALSAIEGEKT